MSFKALKGFLQETLNHLLQEVMADASTRNKLRNWLTAWQNRQTAKITQFV